MRSDCDSDIDKPNELLNSDVEVDDASLVSSLENSFPDSVYPPQAPAEPLSSTQGQNAASGTRSWFLANCGMALVLIMMFLLVALTSAILHLQKDPPVIPPTVTTEQVPQPSLGEVIRAKSSGKCVDVHVYEQKVIQWSCHYAMSQRYLWEPMGRQAIYRIRSTHTSNWCLQVANASQHAAASVVVGECHDQHHQLWERTPWQKNVVNQSSWQAGFYLIKALHTGYCLSIDGGSYEDGANLIQWPCKGYDTELWNF